MGWTTVYLSIVFGMLAGRAGGFSAMKLPVAEPQELSLLV